MKLLITIVDREYSSKVIKLYENEEYNIQFVSLGKGTANSQMLEYFGFGETEKTVIITIIEKNDVPILFEKLSSSYDLQGKTVAFTVSLSSIGKKTLSLFRKEVTEVNDDE